MTDEQPSLDYVLKSLAETRGKLDATEARWKQLRAEGKQLAMALIFDHGYSVAKVSVLTGHHRNTLKIWVDVEAARRNAADRS